MTGKVVHDACQLCVRVCRAIAVFSPDVAFRNMRLIHSMLRRVYRESRAWPWVSAARPAYCGLSRGGPSGGKIGQQGLSYLLR